jgi:tetratricopeptide (TPR) repeat protein
MGRFLEVILETRYPTIDFEVVCVAITAINSHVILPIARDCAKQDGDMWIIYMGNNEMVGPFGAGTIFGDRAPSRFTVKGALLVRSSRIGQLLTTLVGSLRKEPDLPDTWGGIEMFTSNKLRTDDPGRLKAYENFKDNLIEIVRTGLKAGTPVLVSTVGSNIRDCSPFISLHSSEPGFKPNSWETLFTRGMRLEREGAYEAALETYSQAAASNGEYAELHYRMGKCYRELGDLDQALSSFILARDCDALVVRADTRINQIIREAIQQFRADNFSGLDTAALLASHSPDGIPGREAFYEHVHFTVEGNFQVARLMAEKVSAQLPADLSTSRKQVNVDAEFQMCANRLALTLWDRKRVWNVALGRIAVAPFTAQSSHGVAEEYFKQQMAAIDSQTTANSWHEDKRSYEFALRLNSEDALVRWNYAQFLERTGKIPDAIAQGQLVCHQLPHAAWPHYFVGSLMAKEGRMVEAVQFLQMALDIEPSSQHARKELDWIAANHPSALK